MHLDTQNIIDELEASVPTIPEADFRSHFLPLFLGQLPPDVVPTAVSAWVNGVAGSASMHVKVVSPTTGDVLFTVPALLDTSKISITDPAHFGHAFGVHAMLKQNQPELAESLLGQELTSAMQNSLYIDREDKLSPMLTFYNIAPAVNQETVQPTSVLDDLGL